MACRKFGWQHVPRLEIWRERQDDDGNSYTMLESYNPEESVPIFKDALLNNKVSVELTSVVNLEYFAQQNFVIRCDIFLIQLLARLTMMVIVFLFHTMWIFSDGPMKLKRYCAVRRFLLKLSSTTYMGPVLRLLILFGNFFAPTKCVLIMHLVCSYICNYFT